MTRINMKIVVFQQPGLPVSKGCDSILKKLAGKAELQIVDTAGILSGAFSGDFFYNAHGEYYPMDIEDALFAFFAQGGGLLHIGGMPFEKAMVLENGEWREVTRTLGDLRNHEGYGNLSMPMDVFRARLGFTPYSPAYQNVSLDWKHDFDKDLIGELSLVNCLPERSVNLTTTVPLELTFPELELIDSRSYHGRPICRDTIAAGWIVTPDGQKIMPSLLLTKFWGNPYNKDQSVIPHPWAIFTGVLDGSLPEQLVDAMLRWLSIPAVLKNIDLPYATLHTGDSVQVLPDLCGTLPNGWRLQGCQAKMTKDDLLSGKKPEWVCSDVDSLQITYEKDLLLQPVRFMLLDEQNRVRDYTESALVTWDPESLRHTRRLEPDGCYFSEYQDSTLVSRSRWVNGTNWQDRCQYSLTWHNPNPLRVAGDAKALHEAGMVLVRTHYFMPGWFRVMPGEIFAETHGDFYRSFEKGPEISERHLRAIEAHVALFSNMDLILMPTVYTQTGPEMGNPAHWVGSSRLTMVKAYRGAQIAFAKQIMERLGDCASISWDICNEIDSEMYPTSEWLTEMRTIWGKSGQMIGIGTYGMEDNVALGESADWHSIHTPCCKTKDEFRTGKPCLLQEAWVPTPSTRAGEKDLEDHLSKSLAWTLKFGGCGLMPWNWNMSMVNWRYKVGFVDYWDLELGCCVHGDGTPRHGLITMRNWAALMEGLAFDQSANQQVVFIYPKTCLMGGGYEYAVYLKDHNIPFIGVNDRDFANFDLSNTKVVFAPYYALGYREETWQTLRKFAIKGGVVFAHSDNMQLDENGEFARHREIPELPGIERLGEGCIRWHMGYNESDPLSLCDPKLLDSLPLVRRKDSVIPIVNGSIRITERLSTDETTMPTDWIPYDKLPARNIPIKIEIEDEGGYVTRGWAKEGNAISMCGADISGVRPFYVIQVAENSFVAAGTDLTIKTNRQADFTLVDYTVDGQIHPLNCYSPLRKTMRPGETVIQQDGWQAMHWVQVTLE